MNKKLIDYVFKKAEMGEWSVLSYEIISKDLDIKLNELKKIIPNKDSFLPYYNDCIDDFVINSITDEDIKEAEKDEVLKEYFMSKLEHMNKFKLGLANIINSSKSNPKFILINLKSNKKSIIRYTKPLLANKNLVKKNLSIKIFMGIWLLAFQKWLYEGHENSNSYAFIDKSFKFLSDKTSIFNI